MFAFRPAVTPWWRHCQMVKDWPVDDKRWALINDPELQQWLYSGPV